MYAIGECDYQYHGANRLGANSLLSCIFAGLIVAPGIETRLKSQAGAAIDLGPEFFGAPSSIIRPFTMDCCDAPAAARTLIKFILNWAS